jgi:hypothetical protein
MIAPPINPTPRCHISMAKYHARCTLRIEFQDVSNSENTGKKSKMYDYTARIHYYWVERGVLQFVVSKMVTSAQSDYVFNPILVLS